MAQVKSFGVLQTAKFAAVSYFILFAIFMLPIGLFTLVACPAVFGAEELEAFLDRDAICEAWENTYGSIRTMKVRFTTEQVRSEPNRAAETIRTNVERIEQGKLHRTAYSYGVNNDADLKNPIIASFDGINSYEYMTIYKQGSINSGLSGKATDNMNAIKLDMLMDELSFPGDQAHRPSSIPRFLCYLKGDNVRVEKNLEHVTGEACHVITITTKSEEYNADHEIKLWVAHNKGMLLLKHEFHDYIKNINSVCTVSEFACTELETGTIWYPKKIHKKIEHPNRLIERTIIIEEFKPNIKIDESVFKVIFPEGTRVTDNVNGITYVAGKK